MDRAFSNITIKTVSEDRREIEGWATVPTTDRQNDQVMPEGARYELPIPFLLDHEHNKVVGEVYRAEVSAKGIRFWARIQKIAEPGPAKDLVDYAWSLVKHGLRKVVSIGFRPLEFEPIGGGGLRFTAWEWYELSAVGIAAQPGARITSTKAARNPSSVVRLGSTDRGAGRPLRSPPGHISAAEHEKRRAWLDKDIAKQRARGFIPYKPLESPPGHISQEEHEKRRLAFNATVAKSGARGTVVKVGQPVRVVRIGKPRRR